MKQIELELDAYKDLLDHDYAIIQLPTIRIFDLYSQVSIICRMRSSDMPSELMCAICHVKVLDSTKKGRNRRNIIVLRNMTERYLKS